MDDDPRYKTKPAGPVAKAAATALMGAAAFFAGSGQKNSSDHEKKEPPAPAQRSDTPAPGEVPAQRSDTPAPGEVPAQEQRQRDEDERHPSRWNQKLKAKYAERDEPDKGSREV